MPNSGFWQMIHRRGNLELPNISVPNATSNMALQCCSGIALWNPLTWYSYSQTCRFPGVATEARDFQVVKLATHGWNIGLFLRSKANIWSVVTMLPVRSFIFWQTPDEGDCWKNLCCISLMDSIGIALGRAAAKQCHNGKKSPTALEALMADSDLFFFFCFFSF